MAHELIHADRAMRGVSIKKVFTDENTYKVEPKKRKFLWWWYKTNSTKTETVPQEELATMGLGKYNKEDDITENDIRKEHKKDKEKVKQRGAYYNK